MAFEQSGACGSSNCLDIHESTGYPTASPIVRSVHEEITSPDRIQGVNTSENVPSFGGHHAANPCSASNLRQRDISPGAVGVAFIGSVLGFLLIMLLALFTINQRTRGGSHDSDDEESEDPRIVNPPGDHASDKGPSLPRVLVPPYATVIRDPDSGGYSIVRNPRSYRNFASRGPQEPTERVYVRTRQGMYYGTKGH